MPKPEKIAVAEYQLWERNLDSDAETNWLTAKAQLLAKTSDNSLLNSPDVDTLAHRHSWLGSLRTVIRLSESHKSRRAMVRPGPARLEGLVEVRETYRVERKRAQSAGRRRPRH